MATRAIDSEGHSHPLNGLHAISDCTKYFSSPLLVPQVLASQKEEHMPPQICCNFCTVISYFMQYQQMLPVTLLILLFHILT